MAIIENVKAEKPDAAYTLEYNKTLQAIVCKVNDPRKMFPFYLEVKNVGLYKIMQNKTGKIQMCK